MAPQQSAPAGWAFEPATTSPSDSTSKAPPAGWKQEPSGPPSNLTGHAKDLWEMLWKARLPISKLTKPIADRIQKNAEALGNHAAIKGGAEGKYLELSSEMASYLGSTLEAAGNVGESFTSIGSGLMLLSGMAEAKAIKEGATAISSTLRALRAGTGLAFSAQGAEQVATGKTASEKLIGLSMMAGGAAGAKADLTEFVSPETAPRAIPKPKPVTEFGSKRPSVFPKGISPVPSGWTYEPVSTPTGQRKLGNLPESESGAPEATPAAPRSTFAEKNEPQRQLAPLAEGESGAPQPAEAGLSDRRPAPGQRIISTLPAGASGLPEASEGRTFGLRGRAPGDPLTEIQGPTGPKVIRPTSKTAPFQRTLPELPESERAKLNEPGFLRPPKPKVDVARGTSKAPKAPITKVAAKPLPVVEASPVAKIPASWMPHFENLVADARQQGFTGTREELAGKFVDKLGQAVDYAKEMQQFEQGYSDDALLKAIQRAGGLSIAEERSGGGVAGGRAVQGGMGGELENLRQTLQPASRKMTVKGGKTRTVPQRGEFSGVIRRQGGQSVDRIMEALKQDPDFEALGHGSMSDFLEAVNQAARRVTQPGSDVSTVDPGQVLEEQLGVRAGTRWWDPAGAVQLHQMITDISEQMRAAGVPDSHIESKMPDIASAAALLKQGVDAKGGSAADLAGQIQEYALTKAEDYWAQEHMPDLTAGQTEDTLSTGEAQPRLPGEVGAVRDVEVPDAPFEVPQKKLEMRGKQDLRTAIEDPEGLFGFDTGKGELFGGIGAVELPPKVLAQVEGAWKKVEPGVDFVRLNLAGTKFNEPAVQTAMGLRQTLADIAMQEDLRRAAAIDTFKAWRQVPEKVQIGALSDFERTGEFTKAFDPDGSYSRAFQESNERGHGWLREAFGNDAVGEIENYVRHVFDLKNSQIDGAVKALEAPFKRSLSANRSVLRRRVLRMPLDDAINALEKAGIKAKVVETNPELLRQWALNNAYRALRFKELGDYLKETGLTKFVGAGDKPPAGWSQLADRRFQVFFKGEQGLVKAGEYWASEPVKRILNRAVSVGFNNAFYRGLRGTNMIWNQLNLGFSMFHAIETGINAGASEFARAVQAAGRGELGRAAVSLGKSAVGALTFGQSNALELGLKGHALRKAILNADPAAMHTLNEILKPAGARLALEKQYLTRHYDTFRQAWQNNEYLKSLGSGVAAIPEMLAKPLMEQAIPKIKLGAFLNLAQDIDRRMAGAPFTERQKAYALAWDAVDDRFGLLTHDNLFWNRRVSQIAQMSVRSVGWSYGTIRSFGGSAIDATKGIGNLLTGDTKAAAANLLSDRVAFTLGLTTFMAMTGAWYQFLHTGKPPADAKDLFWPQDGGKDANGDPTRAQIKSYLSDIVSYSRSPWTTAYHKTSPELEAAISVLVSNQNFFGDLIRNPDDPANVQAEQVGKFLLQSFGPFSVQQFTGSRKDADTPVASVERFGGVQKAPAWVVQTPLEKEILTIERGRLGERHRTPEEVGQSHQVQDLALQYKQATTKQQRIAILKQLPHPNTKAPSTEELLAFIRRVNSPISETWSTLPLQNRVRLARQYPAEVKRRFPQDYARFVHDGVIK